MKYANVAATSLSFFLSALSPTITIILTMKHFLKFLGIGGMATALQFFVLALLVEFKLAPAIIASAASYFLSAIFNYLANYHITFASNTHHSETLPRFAITACIGLALSTSLFALFLHLFGHYLLAQFLATGITFCLNFLVHKLWIYKGH